MRHSLWGGIAATGIAGLCALAMTSTALAAANGPTTSPEAIGIYANGYLSIANTPDQTTVGSATPVASVTVGTLLTADTLNATVVSDNYDYASVESLSALALLPITSGTITEYCVTTGPGTFSSYAVIEDLSVNGSTPYSATVTATDQTPLTFTVPGTLTALTVTLNQELTGPVTGSETFNAIDIDLTAPVLGTEDIDIASATCGPYNSAEATPLASGKGLGIGLGAAGLLGGAYAIVYVRRRRNALPAS